MPNLDAVPAGAGPVVWLDGELHKLRDAKVSILTHSLHYGTSVFEGIRCYNGTPFLLNDHSRRLISSAERIGFELPYPASRLDAAVESVIRVNRDPSAYVRPIAWRGSGDMGVAGPRAEVHVAIATWSWPRVFSNNVAGIRLATSTWRRAAPDQAPTQAKASGNYLIGAMARQWAEQQGADDALLLDPEGNIAEVSGANLFIVSEGGRVITPPPTYCLAGLTRRTVIELVRSELKQAVEEAPVTREMLLSAEEVFVVGTAYEVQAVRQIDETPIRLGATTRLLSEAYSDRGPDALRASRCFQLG